MKNTLIIFLIVCTACNTGKKKVSEVAHAGALMNIMHKHDYNAKADLDSIDRNHLYALGAIEGVTGEVLVWDGEPYMSVISNNHVLIDNAKHLASLLVYAHVSDWKKTSITNAASVADLEQKLTDLGKPESFPFIIRGVADSLHWHVVNVDPKHPEIPHKKTGLQGILSHENVDLLGFYSDHDQGVFTHHDSKVHIHFKTQDGKMAGHVDGLSLSNVEVLIPEQ